MKESNPNLKDILPDEWTWKNPVAPCPEDRREPDAEWGRFLKWRDFGIGAVVILLLLGLLILQAAGWI